MTKYEKVQGCKTTFAMDMRRVFCVFKSPSFKKHKKDKETSHSVALFSSLHPSISEQARGWQYRPSYNDAQDMDS